MISHLATKRVVPVFLVLVGGILVFFLLSWGNRVVAPSTLRSLLSSEGCEIACWQGIKPGFTDQETARAILDHEEIAFVDVPLPEPETNAVYDFSQAEGNEPKGFVTVSGGIVSQVALNIDACISRVVQEYGEPAEVQESDDYFYLLYPDEGAIFSGNRRLSTTRTTLVYIVSDSIMEGYTEGSVSSSWNEFRDNFAGECDESILNIG